MKGNRIPLILLLAAGLEAQEPLITTIAGTDFVVPAKLPARDAPFLEISSMVVGPDNNLYIADRRLQRIFKLSGGIVSVFAGNGIAGSSGGGENGPALRAIIEYPNSVAFDRAGNLYVVTGSRVRKIDTKGIIHTAAGNGLNDYSGDEGPALNAGMSPSQIALDGSGNLYIADGPNNRIRMVDNAGIVHTIAGNGNDKTSPDGSKAAQSSFNSPFSVAVDSKGNVYFREYSGSTLRRIRKDNGLIETFAGLDYYGGPDPANGADSRKVNIFPAAFAVDREDSLVISTYSHLVRVDQNHRVTVLGHFNGDLTANTPGAAQQDSGSTSLVSFDFTIIAMDQSGHVFNASYDQRIRSIDAGASTFQVVAGSGNGQYGGDLGQSVSAIFYQPGSIDLDSKGNIYVVDSGNHRVREISGATGVIRTVAGNGNPFEAADTRLPAIQDTLYPSVVRVDSQDRPVVINGYAGQVLRLQDGRFTSLLDRELGYWPYGLAIGSGDSIYISGDMNPTTSYRNQISKLGPNGRPLAVAGTGSSGFSGDNFTATSALLNIPQSLSFDADGNLLFIDNGNLRIRRITPGGIISTIAGGGMEAPDEGMRATSAYLRDLQDGDAVRADRFGNVYFTLSNGIYRFGPDGILHVVVGWSYGGFAGDGGPARIAKLARPVDLATDNAGNLYVADYYNNRIRKILKTPPSMSADPTALTFTGAHTGSPTDPKRITVAADIFGVDFTASTDSPWLNVTPDAGAAPRILEVRADPALVPGPGEFDGRVILRSFNAAQHQLVISAHFSVGPAQQAHLTVDKDLLSYTYSVNGKLRMQLLTLSNTGGGSIPFTIQNSTQPRGSWLQVGLASGTVKAGQPVQVQVMADPSGLAAGTYRGQIQVIDSAGVTLNTTVVMTITSNPKAILLSQTGLSFLGVAGGGIIPPQTFSVLSLGTDAVAFSVKTLTLSGNITWLHAVADANTASAGSTPPAVAVSVDQTGLAAGSYYGQVEIDADGAANSPQTVTVFLRVLPADAPPPRAVVQPTELTFMVSSNEPPSSQTVTIYNLGVDSLSFRASAPGSAYVLPYDGKVSPQLPFPVVVQPSYGQGFGPGTLSLAFSDGTLSEVALKSVDIGLRPSERLSARSTTTERSAPRADGDCSTRGLNLIVRYIGQTGFIQGGWPAGMGIEVRDGCDTPLTTGAVTANFSNGDSAVSLTHVGSGVWQGTWASSAGASHVKIGFHAEDISRHIAADREYQTDLTSGDAPPSVQARDVVSYNSPTANAPLAPGSLITFTGTNLTSGDTYVASSTPLVTRFQGLSVVLKDRKLPLLSASPTQVSAMIPYNIDADAPQQLQIQLNQTQSTPIYLNLAQAAPVIVAGPDSHATALVLRTDGQYYITPATPAHPGDMVFFACLGLGAVDQPPPIGDATPALPPIRTTHPVTLQIGGQAIATTEPDNLAMLTPGYVGLYQVTAVLPDSIPTGDAVPVNLTVAGQMSPTVYLSIEAKK